MVGGALPIVAAIALALAPRPARAEPSNGTLVGVGIGLALPTYGVGVTIHESSHALAAIMVGATVDELHLFPPGRDPHVHVFRFGWTYVHGLTTRRDKIFFYLAPKITDAIMLGGFASLAFTDAWPGNRYGALALTVLATGFWVDFAKDVVLFGEHNDVVKAFDLWCLHGWRRSPRAWSTRPPATLRVSANSTARTGSGPGGGCCRKAGCSSPAHRRCKRSMAPASGWRRPPATSRPR